MARFILKEYMKANHIKVKDLAELLPMKDTNLSDIINGLTKPKVNTLIRIAECLQVKVGDLFEEDVKEPYIICPHCGRRILLDKDKE